MSSASALSTQILMATADYKKGFADVNAILQSMASEYGGEETDCDIFGDKKTAQKHVAELRKKIMAASSINVAGSAVLDKSLTTLRTVSIQVPTPGSLNEEGEYVIHTSNASSLMADTLKNASIPKKTVDTHEWTASLCKKMNVLPSGSTSKKRGRANSDDEIQMEEADKSKALKCTLTSNFFVNPMKNKLCGHVVDKSGVAQMMKAKKEQSCPLGVSCAKGKKQKCSWDLYEEDEEMRLKVESYRRREKKREEKRRREDDDDAIDVDEEEGGEEGEEDVEVL